MPSETIPQFIWDQWRSDTEWMDQITILEKAGRLLERDPHFVLNLGCGSIHSYDRDTMPYPPVLTRVMSSLGIPSINVDQIPQDVLDLSLPYARFITGNMYLINYALIANESGMLFDTVICRNVLINTSPTHEFPRSINRQLRGTSQYLQYLLDLLLPAVAEGGIALIDGLTYRKESEDFRLLPSKYS